MAAITICSDFGAQKMLGWCKSNWGFCIVEIGCCLILEYILNKCGYTIHNCNVHFSFYFFLLMTYYLLFIKTMEMLLDKKQRRTKEPLDENERGEWKSLLKTQHSEN